jgi:hypothetical protein
MHEGAPRDGGLGWAWVGVVLILAASVAACAIPFGEDPEAGRPERTPRERNQLFLEEQERLERSRQTLEPVRPSER